ncbi:hypothetical protein ECANGB1_390 [Enterospora canceri]|uniref:Uncharacterized protein n=1 Tax=Enterospora canceri TaxID=1081671 RepID=A0A1Y1S804_9MICR|nr:hypothetical protein ECANGB1_390 [Enterospora canceri]
MNDITAESFYRLTPGTTCNEEHACSFYREFKQFKTAFIYTNGISRSRISDASELEKKTVCTECYSKFKTFVHFFMGSNSSVRENASVGGKQMFVQIPALVTNKKKMSMFAAVDVYDVKLKRYMKHNALFSVFLVDGKPALGFILLGCIDDEGVFSMNKFVRAGTLYDWYNFSYEIRPMTQVESSVLCKILGVPQIIHRFEMNQYKDTLNDVFEIKMAKVAVSEKGKEPKIDAMMVKKIVFIAMGIAFIVGMMYQLIRLKK